MAYIPDPTDPTQPTEDKFAKTAAAEFRAMKAYMQQIVAGGGPGAQTPGMVVYFPFTAAPPGWLIADGSIRNRADFVPLWTIAAPFAVAEGTWSPNNYGSFSSGDGVLTFRLPDLRSEILRGSDSGKGAAWGHAPGTRQLGSRVYDQNAFGGGQIPTDGNNIFEWDEIVSVGNNTLSFAAGAGGAATRTFKTVRPQNIALLPCIKT